MKLDTFFEKFDQIADMPNAVAKMRELVLELAASGRLVPTAIVRKVEDDTKLMGTVVELVMGQAPAGDKYNTEGRGTVFVKVGEFGPLYPREEIWTTNPLKFAKSGDVLVCVVGATVGKLNLAIDCAIGRSVAAIRPSPALNTKFLYYSLIPYTLRLRRNSRGSAQGVIGKVELNTVSLWVPSREVQERIVAKVDELMALCDQLEAKQQEREAKKAVLTRASLNRFADAPTPANLDFLFHKSYEITPADLRKSILTLAVQGKLVPQDPNDELAEVLLKRISAEQERLVKARKIRRIEFGLLADGDEPFEIPSNWVWTRLGQIGDWGSGSTPLRGNTEFYGGSMTWLKSGELNDNRTLAGSEETVTDLALKSCSFRLNRPGDVLIAMYGATIGKAAILAEEAVTNQAVCGCSPSSGVLNNYLFDYLLSQRSAFHAASEGGAQPNISKVKIVSYPFPLPPLAEQHRIVAKVAQLMALVDELETQLAASNAAGKQLLAAIVAELTSGSVSQTTA